MNLRPKKDEPEIFLMRFCVQTALDKTQQTELCSQSAQPSPFACQDHAPPWIDTSPQPHRTKYTHLRDGYNPKLSPTVSRIGGISETTNESTNNHSLKLKFRNDFTWQ